MVEMTETLKTIASPSSKTTPVNSTMSEAAVAIVDDVLNTVVSSGDGVVGSASSKTNDLIALADAAVNTAGLLIDPTKPDACAGLKRVWKTCIQVINVVGISSGGKSREDRGVK